MMKPSAERATLTTLLIGAVGLGWLAVASVQPHRPASGAPAVTDTVTPSPSVTRVPTATWTPGPSPTPDDNLLRALDGTADDTFGYSVDLAGDTAAVGTFNYRGASQKHGAVYVFQRQGGAWQQAAKLTVAADDVAYSGLGVAVDLDGERLAVGANLADVQGVQKGAAYIFRRSGDTWEPEAEVTGDGGLFEGFGRSVALRGDLLAVGAPLEGGAAGAAYVFERVSGTWTRRARLGPGLVRTSDGFGSALAWGVAGQLVVGAPGDDGYANAHGAAFVFEPDPNGPGWRLADELRPSVDGNHPQFGTALALAAGRLAVAGPFIPAEGVGYQGAVAMYAWDEGRWTPDGVLWPEAGRDLWFGWSVALSPDHLVVGVPGDDRVGQEAGAVYVFDRQPIGWRPVGVWVYPDWAPGDDAGWSVAVDGDRALVGVPGDEVAWPDQGSARVVDLAAGPPMGPFPTPLDTPAPTPIRTPGGPPPDPTPTPLPATEALFDGLYGTAFELASFVAGGRDCPGPGIGDWLVGNDAFYERFRQLFPNPPGSRPVQVRVRFVGERHGPGAFGHRGVYRYEVVVRDLLVMEPATTCGYVDVTGSAYRQAAGFNGACAPELGGVEIVVCVANEGNQPVGPFTVATDGDRLSWGLGGLAVGASICLPPRSGSAETVFIDSENEVAEDDEANNRIELPNIPLTPPPTCTAGPSPTPTQRRTPTAPAGSTATPAPVDLVAGDLWYSIEHPFTCYSGQPVGLYARYRNAGDRPTGPFTIAADGVRRSVPGLAARSEGLAYFAERGACCEHTLEVDVDNVIAESNEANNRISRIPPVLTMPPPCTPDTAALYLYLPLVGRTTNPQRAR
jgi:hypothetical protein